MNYKAIIFDFGGVIINIDFSLTHKAFQEIGVLDFEKQFSKSTQSGFFDYFEKGEMSPSDFRKEIKKYLTKNISDQELDDAWNKMLLDIPSKRIEIIEKLKKKYKCVLLSNTNKIHYDKYLSDFKRKYAYNDFENLFHQTFFSHEIGMRKPDSEIYKYVLEKLKLKPKEVLFIDDTEKNILKAKAMGWNTILWNNRELDELLEL